MEEGEREKEGAAAYATRACVRQIKICLTCQVRMGRGSERKGEREREKEEGSYHTIFGPYLGGARWQQPMDGTVAVLHAVSEKKERRRGNIYNGLNRGTAASAAWGRSTASGPKGP